MKIVLTGSTGNITLPLTQNLVRHGHQVKVISRDKENKAFIESLGATPAIGSMEDKNFLLKSFLDADIVYCMVPYPIIKNEIQQIFRFYTQLAENYTHAIEQAGVKKVVILSTVGADMPYGNGLLQYGHMIEGIFNKLNPEIKIKFMRPVGFYENVLAFIPQIKSQRKITTNYGGELEKPWVSTEDIAEAITESMLQPFMNREITYIMSEMLSCQDVATILGTSIGIPELKWEIISENKTLENYIKAGMSHSTALSFIAMNNSMQDGSLYADFNKHQAYRGQKKFSSFAKKFAEIYHK